MQNSSYSCYSCIVGFQCRLMLLFMICYLKNSLVMALNHLPSHGILQKVASLTLDMYSAVSLRPVALGRYSSLFLQMICYLSYEKLKGLCMLMIAHSTHHHLQSVRSLRLLARSYSRCQNGSNNKLVLKTYQNQKHCIRFKAFS
jgi:hypothetical protein